MGTPSRKQLQQCMLPSGIAHHGSESHPRKQRVQRFADESPFIQRKENKPFVSSWTRLLGVAFTSLAAAYFLLLCFRFIESARQWSPSTRSLAARRDESCDSGSVSGDGDEGGSGPTGDSAEGLELESFGEGSPLLHHEAFGLQSTAGGTQEEVVAAGLQGAAGGEEAEAEEAEGDFMDAFYDAVREYVGGVASDSEKSHETCDLHLWESRNMPAEEEHRLIRLFRRMQEAASSCRSLLPVLTRRHRLQLTNHVLKLLALDLGAIYLVKEDKERRRSAVGDSLIKLAKHALYHGHDGAGSKKLRSRLITLTTLITELKQPRHLYKEKAPEKYKRKMIAILATAEVALKNCLGVLNGLLQLREDTSAAQLPTRTVEQQIEVVKSIFRAHADHVARDGSLRQHILDCQKRTRVYALLTTDHFKVSSEIILPVKEQKYRILEAVRAAGGLLQAQQQARLAYDSASGALERESRNLNGKHGELRERGSLKQPQKEFMETLQPLLFAKTAAAHTGAEATRPPLAGVSLWRHDRPPRQGAGPGRQQLHTLGSSWSPQDQLPQLVSPPVSLPESRPSKFRPQAPTTGVLGTHPYFPPPQMPFTRLPRPSGVQQTARPPHSVSSQQAYGGRSAAAPLVSSSPRPRVGVGEPSQRLQPPAPFQGGYSLFGGGGIPPWLPFSQASSASIESRSTASGGRPREGGGAQRRMPDGQDEARDSFSSGRTWSGRH